MTAMTKIDESTAKPKYRYQVKNWAEYDRALVNRGNLTIWFDACRYTQLIHHEKSRGPGTRKERTERDSLPISESIG